MADWNGDGRDDIAYTTAGGLFIRESRADGSRGSERALLLGGPELYDLRVSDVDGDGDPDLTFTRGSEAGWIENSSGTFGAFQPVLTGLPSPVPSFLLTDVNQDGAADAIYFERDMGSNSFGTVRLRLATGAGTFGAPSVIVQFSSFSARLFEVDVDTDGDRDIVHLTDGDPAFPAELELLLSDGAGTFTGTAGQLAAIIPWEVDDLNFADVNGDGLQDILYSIGTAALGAGTYVLPYLGGTSFGDPDVINAYPWLSTITSTDVDRDGLADIVVASSSIREAFWQRNIGGSFGAEQSLGAGTDGVISEGVTIGDFDGDGWQDVELIQANGDVTRFENRAGSPADGFGPGGSVLIQGPLIAAKDVDGDLAAEVLFLDSRSSPTADVTRLIRRPIDVDPSGRAEVLYTWNGLGPNDFFLDRPIMLGDLDEDGFQDAIVPVRINGSAAADLQLLRGTTSGGFSAPTSIVLPDTSIGNPVNVRNDWSELVDVNRDGHLDLVVESFNPAGLRLCPGDGTGGFGPCTTFNSAPAVVSFELPSLVDVDGDGWLDAHYFRSLDAGSNSRFGLVTRRGLPGGDLGPEIMWPSQLRFLDTKYVDVDDDGVLDLIGLRFSVGQGFSGTRVVRFPDPLDLSVAPILIGSVPFAKTLEVLDVDSDGDLDIVALGASGLDLLTRTGPGTFTVVNDQVFQPGGQPTLLRVDLEGDGDQDLVWSSVGNGTNGFVENISLGAIGDVECTPAIVNSTGSPAGIRAAGSGDLATGRMRLIAERLPLGSTTLFITSDLAAVVPMAGGMGTLCLGGSIGRFNGAGEISSAGSSGIVTLEVDLGRIPRPTGFIAVAPGDTWRFSAWYRDFFGGAVTSNFTDAIAVTFQ